MTLPLGWLSQGTGSRRASREHHLWARIAPILATGRASSAEPDVSAWRPNRALGSASMALNRPTCK
jgi:hypothetical protein